jgi:hypothetical protein
MFGLFKSKVESEAQPQTPGETAAIGNWQSILSKADGPRDRYCEAVAALNVKVICELAPVRDRPSYESFQLRPQAGEGAIQKGRSPPLARANAGSQQDAINSEWTA